VVMGVLRTAVGGAGWLDVLELEFCVVFFGVEDEPPNNMYEREMSARKPSTIAAISLLRSDGVLPSNKFINS
jgi:hypothetical protein